MPFDKKEKIMYLKLTTTNWGKLQFVIKEKQKDYDFFEKDDISIFVYGYPFHASMSSWVSANDIYQLYLKKELNFIEELEGIYAIVIIDKMKEDCFVIIDRYGIYSLFYSKNNNHLILSDNISEIITHIPDIKLNQKSIIEYLNFGFKLGKKTHIEDIYEFESSTMYRINKRLQITEETYWNYLDKSNEERITNENFREIFNAHIMNAMILEKKVSLPITGGLDTRTILSACISKKQKLHCYTHGIKKSRDLKLAQKICNYFEINHSVYELNDKWIQNIPSMLEKNAEIFNGLIPSLTFLHVEESYKKEDKKGEVFISGILGNEIWRCLLGREVDDSMNIDDVSLAITKHYINKTGKLTNIYKGHNDKKIINSIKHSVKKELLKVKNAIDPITLTELFVYRNYCSNWASNSLKATGKHFKIVAAFLQKDLLQHNRLLSLERKTNGFIQKYIISKNSSYLTNVPLDARDWRHGVTIKNNLSLRIKGYLPVLHICFRYVANKVCKKIFKMDIFRPLHFTNYSDWLAKYHKKFLLEVLSYEKMVTKEFFKKKELEKIVDLFLNGDRSLTQFMVRLISLETWLKKVKEDMQVI